MVSRHFIPALTSILFVLQASWPALAQAQSDSAIHDMPRYGMSFGPVTLLLFEGQPYGVPPPGKQPDVSRGLVEWQSRSLPPALYPHREELLPGIIADSLWDSLPSLHRPGLGLAGRPITDHGRWIVGLLANQPPPSMSGQADYLSRFVDPFASYTTSDSWTVMMTTVSACGLAGANPSLPVNLILARQAVHDSSMSIGGSVCYWNNSTDAGTNGVGIRVGATIPFN